MTRSYRLAAVGAVLVLLCAAAPARADEVRDRQWHLTSLRIGEAQRLSTGQGIIVGVVDGGVDAGHVDLAGTVLTGADLTTARGGNGWTDLVGHGTGMASLIAAHGHGTADGAMGVAPAAKILPVRVKTSDFGPSETARGIRWAADHGARVINVSIDTANTPALREAVDYALGKDVVVVAGVGLPGGVGGVAAPARLPGVVAVAGVDRAGNVADVSIRGPEVAIAAPATDIMSADKGGYAAGSGTSNSTAIVSGVVALIRAKYRDLDAANVINRLIATADDKGPPGRDQGYGFGIVNPVRALTADVRRVDRNLLLAGVAGTGSPAAASSSPAARSAAPADDGASWIWIGAGVGLSGLVVGGATALLLVRTNRSRARVGGGP